VLGFLTLYLSFLGWGLLGWLISFGLPKSVPRYLGQGLFWVGIPLLIFTSLRRADLSGPVWLGGVVGIAAAFWGLGLGWLWLQGRRLSPQTRGSFLLSATMGNTGYLGYPLVLGLVGPAYFGWAVFYDVFGTLWNNLGGTALASGYGQGQVRWAKLGRDVALNPILWTFSLTLGTRAWPVPPELWAVVSTIALAVIPLVLMLLGMRLQQVSWRRAQEVWPALAIKLVLVPLGVLGLGLGLGLGGRVLEALVVQAAMPPAMACLILSEAYGLDRELTALTIVLGTLGLMITLPGWVWLATSLGG